MLLLAEGEAGESWDPPKKLICSSDFRAGRFLTFPLGDRLSPSAKRRQANRSSLLRAWPQGFLAQKQDFPRIWSFYSGADEHISLQRCWVFGSEAGDTTLLRNVGNSSSVNTQKTRVLCSICIPVLAPLNPLRIGWPRALSTAMHGRKNSRGCSWPVISTNRAIASCPEPRAHDLSVWSVKWSEGQPTEVRAV